MTYNVSSGTLNCAIRYHARKRVDRESYTDHLLIACQATYNHYAAQPQSVHLAFLEIVRLAEEEEEFIFRTKTKHKDE